MNCGNGSCQIPDPQPRRAKPCCDGCGAGGALDALGFGAPPCCGSRTKASGAVPREIAADVTASQWSRMSPAQRTQWERVAARRRSAPSTPSPLHSWRPSGDPVPAGSGFTQAQWDGLGDVAREAWRSAATQGNAWDDYTGRVRDQQTADARTGEAIARTVGGALTDVATTIQTQIRADAARDLAASDARLRELQLRLASDTAAQAQQTQALIAQEQTRQAQIAADANAALARARETEAQAGLVTAQGAQEAQAAASTQRMVLIGGGILVAGGAAYYALRGKR